MDPSVPWTAYAAAASYNRLATAGQFQSAAGEFQTTTLPGHQAGTQAQPTTNQLILQAAHTQALAAGQLGQGATFTPTGFLSPPSVGYDTVFSPLFHHANPKAAAHFRKQSGETELAALHPQGAYFDPQTTTTTAAAWTHQANSQLPSPFGVLPHESVVASSSGGTKAAASTAGFENTFNAAAAQHFAAQSLNHLNHITEFNKAKAAASRSQSPKTAPATTSSAAGTFFQHQAGNFSNSQQSCIVSTASTSPAQAKAEYRVPQSPARAPNTYVNQRAVNEKAGRNFVSPPGKNVPQQQPAQSQSQQQQQQQQQQHVVATKAQTKIYSELGNQSERRGNAEALETTQSSPISFALSYPSNKVQRGGSTTAQYIVSQQNYRFNESEYHARKTGSADSAYSSGSNGPECSAAVPRRPSPLQAHSQASPLGHAGSPAYPIYNSPSGVNQVTPPSPLDVSVTRAGGVAYPSVITRADGRWEGENRGPASAGAQPRNKFPPGYNIDASQTAGQRQQAYFDPPAANANLAACRDDPMSIVKNLHNLQNCNPIPPEAVKQEDTSRTTPKSSQKNRRKSGDKAAQPAVAAAEAPPHEMVPGRVPPPAHLNNPQQQQNGAYFDLERWNLPPPKMYGGHNQHQALMVPHPHHPPPPIPYFPPFHLPPGHHPHPQEFHSSAEITPVAYGEAGSFPQAEAKEENPKVVVPDVEEELGYLSQQAHAQIVIASQQNNTPSTVLPPPIKNPAKKPCNDPSSGFMASYLKFLQGERDTSPPPQNRNVRKPNFPKNKVYIPNVKPTVPDGSVTATSTSVTSSTSSVSAAIKKPHETVKKGNEKPYVPDNDPRFYPLPKSTAKRKLHDSDSSGDETRGRKTYTQMKTVTSAQLAQIKTAQLTNSNTSPPKKQLGRPPKVPKEATPVRQPSKKKAEQNSVPPPADPLSVPQIRETTRRKAKDKTTIKTFLEKQNVEEDADDPDFVDSDADPVWTPAKDDSDGDTTGRKKKSRHVLNKSLSNSKRRTRDEESSSDEEPERLPKKSSSGKSTASVKVKSPQKEKKKDTPTKVEASPANTPAKVIVETEAESLSNRTGEFVVMKSDLHEEYPPIWRIDGKTLLQKYEPFDENGQTLYRNISTYSGWTAQNKHIYVTVPVKFRVQSRMETIVEFMRDEMTMDDPELMQRVMKDLEKYQDSFEVYIQTLISQALDSNFLTEILQEQDEYFLTNVKTIDDVTEDHCRRLLNVTRWRPNLIASVKTYPAQNVMKDLPKEQTCTKVCNGCDKSKVSMRIQVYGQPYNNTTLEGCKPDSNAITEKDFFLCSSCGWRVSLYSKATHQKILMFYECAKRVAEKRTSCPNKDTTLILNELLADEAWLSQLFLDVRTSWAEIEKIEHLSCESNKQLLQNAVASAGIS